MPDVTIYTRQACAYCAAAKRLLDRKGIRYEEFDATAEPHFREEMITRSNGRYTFPQIFVGSTHVGGCDDLYELEAAGGLDELLEA